jgi:Ser/Thr protein kinase RdoA (MazF antagonist)
LTTKNQTQNFYELTPDMVMEAMESVGLKPTGEFLQLNSYENRVFEIRLEKDSGAEQERVVAKFYRPQRWSKDALKDEHQFLIDLKNEGIEVVAPIEFNKNTIFEHAGLYWCLFPKFMGRMPQEFLSGDFLKIGRTLALIHNIGSQKKAEHRPTLSTKTYGYDSLEILDGIVSPEVWHRYRDAGEKIVSYLEGELDPSKFIRIHGDCHRGNLLNNGDKFFFVDFDDFINGPVAQDFWMLLSSDRFDDELDEFLNGYTEIRDFDESQIALFEPLRGLRILHYAKWIATRWSDPSFPRLFPDFHSYTYWAQETEQLERIAWNL